MRGRKPKPAALAKVHGNPGKRKPKKAEPAAPVGDLICPPQVRAVAGAKRYWDHFTKWAPLGILKPVDAPTLATLSMEHALVDKAQRELRKNGHVITTSTGTLIQSPWVGIFHRSTEIARKLAAELGLTVTARARLEAPTPGVPSPRGDEDDDQPQSAGQGGDGLDKFLNLHPDRVVN
jgi:P27 family predicted phage terminase small subunit